MPKSILIIDDDAKLVGLLTEYLARFEYDVRAAGDPDSGLRLLRQSPPEAVILDVMLPGRDGFAVCREIRRESNVPIVMLTARGELTDRVVGLELGADDYLPKPFEPRELVARLEAVLRRAAGRRSEERLRFGDLEISLGARAATLKGKPLDLTTTEFELLSLLVLNPGKAFDRDAIMDALRGQAWEAYSRSVDVLVSRLRQKLKDDPKRSRYLKTLWGKGYVFVAEREE